jgi:hypothetical protein
MATAPIALFAYNRPDHLRHTITALRNSTLASTSTLYIFCDGAKTAQDLAAVHEVRSIARNVSGFAKVTMREQRANLGLAQSIIAGVSELTAEFGSTIVLEDDLVVAPGFLTYMNQALERYRHEHRVMQVSGYMFPVKRPQRYESTFLCRVPTSWGWGTWSRAWRQFSPDCSGLLEYLRESGQQHAFNVNGAYPYFEHLHLQTEGKLDVWGVRWYASMFTAGGLCLYPNRSLVHNIGMDGSGVHCGVSSNFDVELSASDSWTFPDRIVESEPALEAIQSFLEDLRSPQEPSVIADLFSRLRATAGRITRAITSVAGEQHK